MYGINKIPKLKDHLQMEKRATCVDMLCRGERPQGAEIKYLIRVRTYVQTENPLFCTPILPF